MTPPLTDLPENKFLMCGRYFLYCLAITISGQFIHAADFTGSAQCAGCHQSQFKSWKDSHHDMSMRQASSESVMGNFNNATISSGKFSSRFYMENDQYRVTISESHKPTEDHQVRYTLGIDPLQQYIVQFDDGRLQLIPFAWDNRSTEQGGQRWFHLFPDQSKPHQEFYWKNPGQNWNYMCADCHSTDVKKNFNINDNTYNTTYSEINVGCEACHGPASEHIHWATTTTDKQLKKPQYTETMGFDRNLNKQVSNWIPKPGKFTLQPEAINTSEQTLVCAQCHSRHVQISTDDPVKSQLFGDRYLLNLIDSQRYFADGQIHDENYVYGSYLQSKMYQSGVVCSNCHDPHSAKLTLPEEEVCLQCHLESNYATPSHHHHQTSGSGAQCVNCHMPATTYMQIDDRRDHRWHIPNPAMSEALDTPDVCLSCHQDKDNTWSKTVTQSWIGNKTGATPDKNDSSSPDFAPAFAAADQGYVQAVDNLSRIAMNPAFTGIIRASALDRMRAYPFNNGLIAIEQGINSTNEYIRRGAIYAAENYPGRQRWQLLSPLLTDKVLAVRIEAARILAPLWTQLSAEQQAILDPALKDYLLTQDIAPEKSFSHTNKGIIYTFQGKLKHAEEAYNTGIRVDPYYPYAYINLADIYRQQNKYQTALQLLQSASATIPDNSDLLHNLGLAYIRTGEKIKAIPAFKKASQLAPANAHYLYVYGLSLESTDISLAIETIEKAFESSSDPQHLHTLCDLKSRHINIDIEQCLNF